MKSKENINKKGQALVEFALVLPIFLLLVFGIIEFGRIFNAELVVANASRQGAREAAVGITDGAIQSDITDLTKTLGTVIPTITRDVVNDKVTVQINHSLPLVTPIVGTLISSSGAFNVQSSTTMRIE